jgi:hypothetical protein
MAIKADQDAEKQRDEQVQRHGGNPAIMNGDSLNLQEKL